MPAVLREPSRAAAAEPQKSRCSLPGDSDCGEVVDDDVVVVRVLAALVLRAVDGAQAGLDAELLQILHVGQHDPLELGRRQQELGVERLALVVAQHVGLGGRRQSDAAHDGAERAAAALLLDGDFLDRPAGFGQKLGRLAHVIAEIVRRVVDRVLPLGGEHLRRDLALHLVEQLQLAALRQALVGELGIVEVAADADIEIVEQLLVGFLEVEGQREGAAHARILRTACGAG